MNKSTRKYCYLIDSILFGNTEILSNQETIDVVIPVVEKDLKILPLCLEGVRRKLEHPCAGIYIVAPAQTEIIDFCHKNNVTFVNENTVMGFSPTDIPLLPNGTNRRGWIFQQLVKLSGNVGMSPKYLVIDADHILLKPHTFISRENKTVCYGSKEFHQPYYDAIEFLLGRCEIPRLSFVAHKMLFSRDRLQDLKTAIEKHTGMKWYKAICSLLEKNEMSPFSEYETFGTFLHEGERTILPWRNKNLKYSEFLSYDELRLKYGKKYRAVTFPDYLN